MQERSGIERTLPWVPTILGVLALVVFSVVTIARLTPRHSRTLPPPQPAFTLPGTTSGPQAPVSLIPATAGTSPDPVPTSRAIPAVITPPRHTTAPTATTKPAPPVVVSGRFHVLNSYADNFIGEVLLTNRTGAGLNWV